MWATIPREVSTWHSKDPTVTVEILIRWNSRCLLRQRARKSEQLYATLEACYKIRCDAGWYWGPRESEYRAVQGRNARWSATPGAPPLATAGRRLCIRGFRLSPSSSMFLRSPFPYTLLSNLRDFCHNL